MLRSIALLALPFTTAWCVAQDEDHVRPDSVTEEYVRPLMQRSISVDVFGPAITLLNTDPAMVRIGVASEWMGERRRSWRFGYQFEDDRLSDRVDDLVYRGDVFLLPKVDEHQVSHVVTAGLVLQDRDKRIATRIGAGLQLGYAYREWREEGLILRPDTLPCNECLLHVEGVYEGLAQDRSIVLGVEGAVGITGMLGQHCMVEFRFPLQLRTYLTLDSTQEGTLTVPDSWDDPVTFGIGWPGIFVHYWW